MKTHIKAPDGELCFRASIIDGTGISISEFLTSKMPNATDREQVLICLFQEFYKLLGISVQTETEEQFLAELEKIWSVYTQRQQ